MVKSVKSLLCLILSLIFTVCFTGCATNPDTTQTTVGDTTQQTTVQLTTATNDTVPPTTEQPTYNYNKIKQNSDKIKNTYDQMLVKNKFRGAVYSKLGNDFEYIGTNGFSSKEQHTSNSANTCYRIGSVTKQFTATAIMMLQEQGKLSTDDTIDKYFSSYKYGDKITIKNLLTMTSGIKDYLTQDGEIDSSFYLPSELGYSVSSKNSASKNKNAIMDWIFDQKLNFEPGEKYMFSNSGYFLLGDIIENVSGMSYEKFVTENIFKPLGMNSSGFEKTDSLATGYQDVYDNEWTLYPGVAYSSSGMISNIADLLKWVDAFTDNEIISEESFEEMTTKYVGNYGYGFFVEGNTLSQKGKIEKFNAKLDFEKDESSIFIALSNYTQADPTKIISEMLVTIKPFYG